MIKYLNNNKFFENIAGKNGLKINNTTKLNIAPNKVPYLSFNIFDDLDWLKIAFSTREGGVSKDYSSSMNFCLDRGDSRENVMKNFELFTEAINTTPDRCVCTKQTHTTNVLKVDGSNAGMGVTTQRNFDNIDGLITKEHNLCLVTAFADCVPVYFADTKNHCIGASHSGWRGTVGNITHNTVKLMADEFNTKPENIRTFIGPCICSDCYEVSEDVIDKFKERYNAKEQENIFYHTHDDKYQLNLTVANYYNMVNEGILPENIGVSDICTCCNPEFMFSHRATNGKRGVMCGFAYIK